MRKIIIGKKDIEILDFLWRFKIATTTIIAAKFSPKATQWSVYQRLVRLASGGFITSQYPDCGKHHFWILGEKGFEIVRGSLPELKQVGYKSENVRHDFLVLAAHLGLWLNDQPGNVNLFTEQELRRIEPAYYLNPIPQSQSHRPDGYWIIDIGNRKSLIALEVELSQKSYESYESVARFYYKDAYVDQVLWIVQRMEQGLRMLERFQKVASDGADVHSFALVSEFIKLNWQSKIVIGKDRGHSILDVFQNMTRTRLEQVLDLNFYDTRKNPKDSDIKQNRENLFRFN